MDKSKQYIFLIPAAALLAFTVFKAFTMSFTIDESTSFMYYVLDTYKNIFSYVRIDANNHLLNSVLMKFFGSWLPLSELTLRLPNLIAHAVYLLSTWVLVKDFKNLWFRLGAYLLLNLNPFMLDFFSLARGYGLSWGFLVLSLYFFKRFVEGHGHKFLNVLLCFIVAALSVLASFPTVDFYLAILVVYIIYDGCQAIFNEKSTKYRKAFWIRLILVIAISAALLFYTGHINYMMLRAKSLYFGGSTGFWADTVTSLIISALYNASYKQIAVPVLQALVIFITAGTIAILVNSFLIAKEKFKEHAFMALLSAMLFLIILCNLAQHYIFGANFLVDRTGEYILVIFLINTVFFLNKIIHSRFRLIATFFVGGIPLFHFLNSGNLSTVCDWKMEACTKQMMRDLGEFNKHEKKTADGFVFFNPFWVNARTCMFYQYLYRYDWILPIEYQRVINHSEDYYYLPDDQLGLLTGYSYQIIREYPFVHETLVKNLCKKEGAGYGDKVADLYDTVKHSTALQKTFPLLFQDGIKCVKLNKDVFSQGINFDGRFLQQKSNITIRAFTKLYFPKVKNGAFVVSIRDKDHKVLKWYSYDLSTYMLRDSGWMTVPVIVYINEPCAGAEFIEIFIWNTGQQPIYASEIKAEIRGF